MDPEMTPDQKSEHTEIYELTPGYRRVVDACEISSQSEEMKLGMLARKLSPALIPIVGVRVALGLQECTQSLKKKKLKEHTTRRCIVSVQVQR